MSRRAVLGGTFDPIHNGHIGLALAVAQAYELSQVVLMPAGNPSLKQDANVAPVHHRVAMARLACQCSSLLSLDTREAQREGVTFTADTLAQLSQEHPDQELLFVIGADCALSIMHWNRAEEIARLCKVIAVARPGFDFFQAKAAHANCPLDFDIDFLEASTPDVSSTMVRQRIARGLPVDDLVPPAVALYIQEQGLYGAGHRDLAHRYQ